MTTQSYWHNIDSANPINWNNIDDAMAVWCLAIPGSGGRFFRNLLSTTDPSIGPHITLIGDTIAAWNRTSTRPGGYSSYHFSGSAGVYGQLPIDLSSTNKITIAFWSNYPAISDNNILEYTADFNSNAGGFLITPSSEGGGDVGLMLSQGDSSTYNSSTFSNPALGNWHHWIICFDRSLGTGQTAVYAYVDGQSQALTFGDNGNITGNFANSVLNLGSRNGSSRFFEWSFDDLAIWKRNLSTEEALDWYISTCSGHEDKLRRLEVQTLAVTDYEYVSEGGLILSGESNSDNAGSVGYVASGGLILSGEDNISGNIDYTGEGGLILSGEDNISGNIDYTGEGGLTLSGTCGLDRHYVADGGLLLGGSATIEGMFVTRHYEPTGEGLTLGGESDCGMKSSHYVADASEPFRLLGESIMEGRKEYAATGELRLSGEATVVMTLIFPRISKTQTSPDSRTPPQVNRQKKSDYLLWGRIKDGIIPAVTQKTKEKIWNQ